MKGNTPRNIRIIRRFRRLDGYGGEFEERVDMNASLGETETLMTVIQLRGYMTGMQQKISC